MSGNLMIFAGFNIKLNKHNNFNDKKILKL